MPYYRKRPLFIEALQYFRLNHAQVVGFIGESAFTLDELEDGKYVQNLYIQTLEGDMRVMPEDYVIKGISGEFYPCKPDIFLQTYEEVQ
jgi:hypothetical protein